MYIHEAVKKAQAGSGLYVTSPKWHGQLRMSPRREGLGCTLYDAHKGKIADGWQPNVDDLTADDWDVCTFPGEET